jgi:hypothetical protein
MRTSFFAAVTLSALVALSAPAMGTLLRAQTDTPNTPNTPHKGSPADRPVAIYSMGNDSCATWSDAWTHRGGQDTRVELFDAYLNGFATAYNIYGPDDLAARGNNVLNNSLQAQHTFLEKYCSDHPLDLYLDAINQMLADLRPKGGA